MERTIGTISQIPPGEGRNLIVGDGLRIAVFHTRDGHVFATQAECPHLGGPLADGLIDNKTVVCPLHDRIYDLATGAGIGTECSVRVYEVRLAGDGRLMLDAGLVGEMAGAGLVA